jgi:hypothetical protein
MPTISQLPTLADVTAADAIPVSQNGATHSVSVGALLASTQPAAAYRAIADRPCDAEQ